ncbi:hypothetical protein ACFFLZ_06420 [Photobacterium aphoticum]|uniref:Uncharacterized protein n=1 Tax=Photobacterium aphoticum TaxID=754436 RepID=A0A0J1GQR4_9GAMM|nr:hypothetical protein [Photobacterium aphoticum]KLV01996.1 hypothetical protein ABT58_06320 [Photobacterium aphoticum]PSU60242.1 hypothetical protein C9I90_01075 [Photobacterium aphoticum]GHA34312.1 hypothetical protein GCM10007086_04690 [Photobacterium aphoticum]
MKLVPCPWDEALPALRTALGDYANDARREILAGREAAYRIGQSYALLRVEQYDNGDLELVAVAFSGCLKSGARALFAYGRDLGCRFIRCHTMRPAQVRFLQMAGLPVYADGKDDDGYLMIKADYGRTEQQQ